MSAPENDLFLRALRMERTERRPVWLMRQAGRYMEEYRRVRKKAGSFMDMCRSPQTCCELAMQPVDRFGLDAAIVFSDILTIPAEMRLGLEFVEGVGPVFSDPLDTEAKMLKASQPAPESLRYVFDAVVATKKALGGRIPLIGFSGAPFTLMCYMVEGRGGDFMLPRLALRSAEAGVRHVLETNSAAVAEYLCGQAEAGADAAMLFESWGDLLSDSDFESYSAPYLRATISAVRSRHPDFPLIVFARAGGRWCEQIAAMGCDAVSVDWRADLGDVRRRTGGRIAVQGNVDPAILLSKDPVAVESAAERCIAEYGPHPGHIFNLGHGIDRRTPPENVEALVRSARLAGEKMLRNTPGP